MKYKKTITTSLILSILLLLYLFLKPDNKIEGYWCFENSKDYSFYIGGGKVSNRAKAVGTYVKVNENTWEVIPNKTNMGLSATLKLNGDICIISSPLVSKSLVLIKKGSFTYHYRNIFK